MATYKDVKAKIEKWADKSKARQQVLTVIDAWGKHVDGAAELIAADGKSLKDCWNYVTKKVRGNGTAEVGDDDVIEWILEYFGAKDAKGEAEGGVIYWYYMEMAEKFKPRNVPHVEERPAEEFNLFDGLKF